jgi:hypothetical protein
VEVGRLIPRSKHIAKGAGRVGAVLELKGSGNSIGDAAAAADGRVAAPIADGRVSNLRDAASSLNFGKVLMLLAGGDRDIRVNCGGIEFDVKGGRGTSKLFVIDTEQTQILGGGGFDQARSFPAKKCPPAPSRTHSYAATQAAGNPSPLQSRPSCCPWAEHALQAFPPRAQLISLNKILCQGQTIFLHDIRCFAATRRRLVRPC